MLVTLRQNPIAHALTVNTFCERGKLFVRVVEANRIDVVIDVVIARMHVMTISHRSNVAHADQTRDKKTGC